MHPSAGGRGADKRKNGARTRRSLVTIRSGLSRAPDPSRSFLLAANVRLLFQHVADAAPIDDIGCGDFVVILAAPAAQPNVNSFVESELGFAGSIVLNEGISHAKLSMW